MLPIVMMLPRKEMGGAWKSNVSALMNREFKEMLEDGLDVVDWTWS